MSNLQAVERTNTAAHDAGTWFLRGFTYSLQHVPGVKWLMSYVKERRDYNLVSALGDAQLRDIGLNRHDVFAAAADWHPMTMLGKSFAERRH
jgi:uncharacterized protein YjiS (DUF1127 family)